ncbi:MAG: ClbS/DfsB family four-helix bundle protein [Proteobacteria bacterium]|nr:ClbS/DfsB family four-helix bundle protein [Pseudomonadota bacterium]
MARPKTKQEMLEAAKDNFEKLWQLIDSMSEEVLNTEFDFSGDSKKKEAHWKRDKNLRDILIHLYEWHQLLLKWINSNKAGANIPFLPEPYTWKTYGDMNVEFWKKHQKTELEDAMEMLNKSHDEVMALMETLSNEELFTKQYFDWTGTTSLGSYCISALSSHYDWALKKLRAHARMVSQS